MLPLLASLVACTPPDPGDDSAAPLPAATTAWWHGESRGHEPDKISTEVPEEVWIARTVDPAAATIVEDLVQGGRWHVAYDVVGDQFSGDFVTDDGTLAVTGALYGETWAWDSWGSASTYVDGPYLGMYVTSVDEVRPSGALVTTKLVYTAEDVAVWQIDEESEPSTEVEFTAAWDAEGG